MKNCLLLRYLELASAVALLHRLEKLNGKEGRFHLQLSGLRLPFIQVLFFVFFEECQFGFNSFLQLQLRSTM